MKTILKRVGIAIAVLFVLFCAFMVLFGDTIPNVPDWMIIPRFFT